ncbi:MAG: questin oxidase family protein [Gammaproteobacteria bacterium]|nr:questin oxidase family protein [Gammaproteobacteria bacterium]
MGDLGAYGSLLAYFDREVARVGAQATLENWLPRLVSGWVRFAFHPVIRLAYGIRFDVESEIVAGLAYLASAGPDPALQAFADGASYGDEPLSAPASLPLDEPFERRYNATVASGVLAERVVVVPDNRRRLAELSLAVFNDTQGFFALHMVTGTHALAVCADVIGMDTDGLLSAGLLAAYVTVGAPRYDPAAEPRPASIDDEHDAKLAFACADLARSLGSKAFKRAAQTYGDVRPGLFDQ